MKEHKEKQKGTKRGGRGEESLTPFPKHEHVSYWLHLNQIKILHFFTSFILLSAVLHGSAWLAVGALPRLGHFGYVFVSGLALSWQCSGGSCIFKKNYSKISSSESRDVSLPAHYLLVCLRGRRMGMCL